jgi:hypothetical protein
MISSNNFSYANKRSNAHSYRTFGAVVLASSLALCLTSSTVLCEASKVPSSSLTITQANLLKFRPSATEYERIDHIINDKKFSFFKKNHAIHETLAGEGLIEVYEIYKKRDGDEIMCLIKFGGSLNGHPGIVHGGEIAS